MKAKKYVEKGQEVFFVEKIPQDKGVTPLLVNRKARVLEIYRWFLVDENQKIEKIIEEGEDVVELEVDFKLSDLKDLHWSASAKSSERKLVVPGVYPGKNANQYFI